MFNSIKKQIFEIISTIHKANEEIKRLIDEKKDGEAIEILAECQEAARKFHELIEEEEGKSNPTVFVLEKYYKELYQISQKIGTEINGNGVYKTLRKTLLQVENSIRNDIPTKYEVAFFPYKASMWDSMESVWMAAKEEPNVEALVVPVPYYDKNPDQSRGEMHYEGNLYPDYVPVVSWENYHPEERKPDIAIIHNPFDETNFVTQVHEKFYAANLKKYTDMLVYIPYFVAFLQAMGELSVFPGIIHADRIIVQPESRENYIRYLREWAKGNDYSKYYRGFEKKFLPLGSPKFDKVTDTRREDCIIPKEWDRLIYFKDGNKRKVVLYNTSIHALLTQNEKMLRKMEDVFNIFRNRKDMVLLWRPHPLLNVTCAAMRPEIVLKYNEITARYREENWGIYDDTPELNRAIAISDAYYGDGSSLVTLYKVIGKPVMIQNTEILYLSER